MEEKKNAKQVQEIKDEELDQVTGGIKVEFKPAALIYKDMPNPDEKDQGTPDQQ